MSITLLNGAPGHGKSYTLVRIIYEEIRDGKLVVTNVPLRHDWPEVMARHNTLFSRWRHEAVAKKAAEYASRVLVTDDLQDILRVRLEGKGEDRGCLVIDEAHRHLNTRSVEGGTKEDGTPMKRAESVAARQKVVNYLSAHRHYGFKCWLASQDDRNLDTQVQRLYEFKSDVRNFRRLPFFGSIFRFNLFLRVTRWNDKAHTKAGINLYTLSKKLANLYNTHALQDVDWPDNVIMLPRPKVPELSTTSTNVQEVPIPAPSVYHGEHEDDLDSAEERP